MKKLLTLALALCLLLTCCLTATAEEKTYEIGVLQFVQHEALDAATQGFIDVLNEKLGDKVKIDVQNASGDSVNCATVANTFVSGGVDLIMANATPALQACMSATADIPILGTSVTDYATALEMSDWTGVTGLNVSGTSDLAPLDGQAAMIKELFPDAKTVGLLYCSGEPNSAYQVKVISGYLTEMGYECKEYPFADSNDVAAVALQATECDVIYVPTDNTAAAYTELVGNTIIPTGTPVVAGEEGICRGCGVATLTISYYDIGRATGEMAYEILVNGANPAEMPIQSAPEFTKKYNPVVCEQLNMTAPEGYVAME